MHYATLMAHLEIGQTNAGLLQIAGDLAERLPATVVGITARQPVQIAHGEGYAFGELLAQDLNETQAQIAKTETQCRLALQHRVGELQWRSTMLFDSLSEYLARQSRCADLVITGVGSGALFDPLLRVNMDDLVMKAGRPVLVVPAHASELRLEWVVVGWEDTREARRAVLDALPLLRMAAYVTVVEIADKEDEAAAQIRVGDVVDWLQRHGVKAQPQVSPLSDDGVPRLYAVAQEQGADLIVAGAYGHNLLREWVFGGVTRDLLRYAQCCLLLSH